jgi:hypothetical protein
MSIQRRKAISFKKFLQRIQKFLDVNKAVTEATTFYIYRTDNNSVLAHGLNGYEAAQNKANQLCKQLGLKWDQVRFKSEKKSAENPVRQNFGKGIIKQPGEHIYASPSNNLSRIRLQRKDWDEGFIG